MHKISKIILVLLVAGLCGCTRISNAEVPERTASAIEAAVTSPITSRVNINKGFISYYLEPSVGRRESDKANSVFQYIGHEIVLSVDVAAIVSAKYYSAQLNTDFRQIDTFSDPVYEEEGSFLSGTGLVKDYRFTLSRIDSQTYAMLLQTSNLVMASTSTIGDTAQVAAMMMRIMRTCRVDEEKVVTAYSQKELVNYTKKTLDIFHRIYPENGSLEDMLNQQSKGNNQ